MFEVLFRWQVDPKAEAVKSMSPYCSMANNPISFNDPEGDLPFLGAVAIGAAVGVIGNGVNNSAHDKSFFSGAAGAAFWGGVGGAFGHGVGNAFGAAGAFGHELARAGSHAYVGGLLSGAQGSNIMAGALSSGIGSGVAGGINGITPYPIPTLQIVGGGLSGGISSAALGGNFWDGVKNGFIVSALNHVAHISGEGLKLRHLLGPDAWGLSANQSAVLGAGLEQEAGWIKILRGPDKGKVVNFYEAAVSAGYDIWFNGESTFFYYTGKTSSFRSSYFAGQRTEVNVSFTLLKAEIGGTGLLMNTPNGKRIIGIGVTLGVSLAPTDWTIGGGGSINQANTILSPINADKNQGP